MHGVIVRASANKVGRAELIGNGDRMELRLERATLKSADGIRDATARP